MTSNRLPSGSRKYTLSPAPRAPLRRIGPCSTGTPWARRSDGVGDRIVPDEAHVGAARRDRRARDRRRTRPRSVHVELLRAEAIAPARRVRQPDQLGADDVAIERVGALPAP